MNPDIVLRDLVKIFHPELVQEECVYYKQLKIDAFPFDYIILHIDYAHGSVFFTGLGRGAVNIPIRDVWAALTGES